MITPTSDVNRRIFKFSGFAPIRFIVSCKVYMQNYSAFFSLVILTPCCSIPLKAERMAFNGNVIKSSFSFLFFIEDWSLACLMLIILNNQRSET